MKCKQFDEFCFFQFSLLDQLMILPHGDLQVLQSSAWHHVSPVTESYERDMKEAMLTHFSKKITNNLLMFPRQYMLRELFSDFKRIWASYATLFLHHIKKPLAYSILLNANVLITSHEQYSAENNRCELNKLLLMRIMIQEKWLELK